MGHCNQWIEFQERLDRMAFVELERRKFPGNNIQIHRHKLLHPQHLIVSDHIAEYQMVVGIFGKRFWEEIEVLEHKNIVIREIPQKDEVLRDQLVHEEKG